MIYSKPGKQDLFCSIQRVAIDIAFVTLTGVLLFSCGKEPADLGPEYSGGATTVFHQSRTAFSLPAANLDSELLPKFTFGNRVFNTNWVQSGASVESFDGLGPVFNRSSCSGCHLLDGRGQPPASSKDSMESMLVRVSIEGESNVGGPRPHPIYGDQLNDKSILGIPSEGSVSVQYTEISGRFPDGERFSLRRPRYVLNLKYGGEKKLLISPRVAPSVFGTGLLEAISDDTLRDLAAGQKNSPVSGKINIVYDKTTNTHRPGKFGWKANVASLEHQSAGAANGDMGITTSLFPEENIGEMQVEAATSPNGGRPEMSEKQFHSLLSYLRCLGVPARRMSPQSIAGEKLFKEVGCANCHVPTLQTGRGAIDEVTNQVIHPYTDLLLHDMGEGLSDDRPDFLASGSEWRTPPLWGIGLQQTVNKHEFFLHDGRARGFKEAILWHDGEAKDSKIKFMNLTAKNRETLLEFLRSL